MIPSLDGRRFTEADRVLTFREDREGTVTASYSGGSVVAGTLAGRRDGADLEFGFSQIERNGVITVGRAEARLELLADGRLRVHESWEVPSAAGTSVLEELPDLRWVRTRVAHPTRSIPAAVAFYGRLLGFAFDGPHAATPFELVIIDLPGGAQLELTAGGATPVAATGDDLLVVYLPTAADVAVVRDRLVAAGVSAETPANPYWQRMGVAVRDPDGRLVVVGQLPG
ncbi:MAG TPA: VOC family protein [Mycobacteriales bacterium]|nr:VOC family protein [Mycobacteriales bacterium]